MTIAWAFNKTRLNNSEYKSKNRGPQNGNSNKVNFHVHKKQIIIMMGKRI